MSQDNILALYHVIDQSRELLAQELQVSQLESFAETLQNLVFDQKAQEVDGLPSKQTIEKLTQLYNSVPLNTMTSEQIRKATQLAYLNVIKQSHLHANQHITPDSIAYFIAFIVEHLTSEDISLLDVSAGVGNLISVIQEKLKDRVTNVQAVEVDDVLVSILAMNTQLQTYQFDIKHQDGVLPLLIDTPNVIVSDLPIGFYPHDDKVAMFKVATKQDRTYAHHALIENSLSILKEGGWGIYLVPSNLFESAQSTQILNLLTQHQYYLQAFLTLPGELFQSKTSRKAILIVQKAGDHAKKAKEVLLGEIPSFKNAMKLRQFIDKFTSWANELK